MEGMTSFCNLRKLATLAESRQAGGGNDKDKNLNPSCKASAF